MTDHQHYMARCIQLALLGAGHVAPNPMVGSVLVHRERIIGEGYHQQYGKPHAEVNCLASVATANQDLIPDSTLYVSLEPCAHYGKTPPCADLIIRHGIKKVVIGCRDPFPAVDGKGIEKLQKAGVSVEVGVLESACIALNKRFFCFHQQKRPFIVLKWAQSANACLAAGSGERTKISNALADRLVHRWRSEEAGIMVGTKTALIDRPALTNRYWFGAQPVKLLLDADLKVPEGNAIFSGGQQVIVFNQKKSGQEGNRIYIRVAGRPLALPAILEQLYSLGIASVLVEGGSRLLQSFIDAGCWDEARVITNSELVLENGYPAPELKNGKQTGSWSLQANKVSIYHHIR